MPQADLQVGKIVKHAGTAQAQRVDRGFHRETPGRAHQPGVPLVVPGPGRYLHAGMQVKRHIEIGNRGPEVPVFGDVIIYGRVRFALLGKSIHHCPFEAEFIDAALQFCRGGGRVLHGQCGHAGIAARVPGNRPGDFRIGFSRQIYGFIGIQDCLQARGVERQQRHFDTGFIHERQPFFIDVKEFQGKVFPSPGVAGKRFGISYRFFYSQVFFKSYFSFHDSLISQYYRVKVKVVNAVPAATIGNGKSGWSSRFRSPGWG